MAVGVHGNNGTGSRRHTVAYLRCREEASQQAFLVGPAAPLVDGLHERHPVVLLVRRLDGLEKTEGNSRKEKAPRIRGNIVPRHLCTPAHRRPLSAAVRIKTTRGLSLERQRHTSKVCFTTAESLTGAAMNHDLRTLGRRPHLLTTTRFHIRRASATSCQP